MKRRTFLMSNGQMAVIAIDREQARKTLVAEHPEFKGIYTGFQLLDNINDFSLRDRDILIDVWPRIRQVIKNRCFWTVAEVREIP